MAYNSEYPYFSAGSKNIDWLLHTVKEVQEGYASIAEQIATLTSEFTSLKSDFAIIESEFTTIQTNFDALSEKVDDMYQYIDKAIEEAVIAGVRTAMVQFRQEFLGYIETLQNDFEALRTLVEEYYISAKAYADTQDDALRNEFDVKLAELTEDFESQIQAIWDYLETLGLNVNNPYRSYKPDSIQNIVDDVFNITDTAQSFNIYESRAYGLTCNDYQQRAITCSQTHNDLRYRFRDFFEIGKRWKYSIWSGLKVPEWLADYDLLFAGKSYNTCSDIQTAALTCDTIQTAGYSNIDLLTLTI